MCSELCFEKSYPVVYIHMLIRILRDMKWNAMYDAMASHLQNKMCILMLDIPRHAIKDEFIYR